MIRGLYAPSDFESIDMDPSMSAQQKLAVIKGSPVLVTQSRSSYHLGLPFVAGLSFDFISVDDEMDTLNIGVINVGDAALYGKGIGSRLVRAATRFGVETHGSVNRLTTAHARLGLLNTVVRVFGEENVVASSHGRQYGTGTGLTLGQLLEEMPPEPGKQYSVQGLDVSIDRTVAAAWEMPQRARG